MSSPAMNRRPHLQKILVSGFEEQNFGGRSTALLKESTVRIMEKD